MFIEQRWFDDAKIGMSGGPTYSTSVKMLRGGWETRNSLWQNPRRNYTVAVTDRNTDLISEMLDLFADTAGALNGFRIKDWTDCKSCRPLQTTAATDQMIGIGDGTTYYFRLVKKYGAGYSRRIMKPVVGTVSVAVGGIPLSAGNWFLDPVNGVVILKDAPAVGAEVTAGFQFDVPVRFGDDSLQLIMQYHQLGGTGDFSLMEIRIREEINIAAYDAQRALL
jgi:uncharacterized protein (TIGR02217 family)